MYRILPISKDTYLTNKNGCQIITVMWIYCITSKTTGKKYVGKTKRPISTRWAAHCYDAFKRGLNTHFARAIRKYGKDDFVIELLELCSDLSQLSMREIYWIQTQDSYCNGCNSTKGGDGGIGIRWSEEARKRQSDARMGMKFSKEHRANLSKAREGKTSWNKGLSSERNPLTGRKRPQEVCHRISESKCKPVQQLTMDGQIVKTFPSLQEAALELGIGRQNISKCCNGQRQKTGGYRWRHV